ncbi:MAG TPA: hypothetical protein VF644_03045 [Pyrinomonadaceae bacterium]
MRKILLITILLCAAGSIFAQDSTPQTAAQATKKVIRWGSPDSPKNCCRNYMRDGRLVTVYDDEKVNFLLVLDAVVEKKYVVVEIYFLNKTEQPFTVYPDKFSLRFPAPENKVYPAIPAEDVAKKMEKRGLFRFALAGALAGMATKQSTATVRDNNGNRAEVVVTEPDRAAQQNVQRNAHDQRASNEVMANAVRSLSLTANTLFKDQIASGLLFFKKEKLPSGLIVSFELDGVTYEIPYGTERVPESKK